jgi:serine/threonine-protein kinase
MPLITGQMLNNRYRIVKLLGQGGFGAVYRAWDVKLQRPCAIKERFESSPEGQRQFAREAQIFARLSHPNLARVTDFFTLPEQGLYLVMDYVEGQDLDARLAQDGRLPEAQVLEWIRQVCEALHYLHSQVPPIIHRDIKPANIKITPDNRAMLVDFGLARPYDPQSRTTQGARAVTPGYSPIEQYGKDTPDARVDVYALGATLYMLLTGVPPLDSTSRVVGAVLAAPRQLNPIISRTTGQVILKCLELSPENRFNTIKEMQAVLYYRTDAEFLTPVTAGPATMLGPIAAAAQLPARPPRQRARPPRPAFAGGRSQQQITRFGRVEYSSPMDVGQEYLLRIGLLLERHGRRLMEGARVHWSTLHMASMEEEPIIRITPSSGYLSVSPPFRDIKVSKLRDVFADFRLTPHHVGSGAKGACQVQVDFEYQGEIIHQLCLDARIQDPFKLGPVKIPHKYWKGFGLVGGGIAGFETAASLFNLYNPAGSLLNAALFAGGLFAALLLVLFAIVLWQRAARRLKQRF